jgi:hypothetical protein
MLALVMKSDQRLCRASPLLPLRMFSPLLTRVVGRGIGTSPNPASKPALAKCVKMPIERRVAGDVAFQEAE